MNLVNCGPTVSRQILRALARYPERDAFVWDGGRLTYAATLDLIGRMQVTFAAHGLKRGQRAAILTANRAEGWCAGAAAQASGLAITWLHPMGSLADQRDQLEDFGADLLVVDAGSFADRGGELAAGPGAARVTLTLGPASYGHDLLAAAEAAGAVMGAVDLAQPGDVAVLNYTGGTTGKSKGVLRRHRNIVGSNISILADFDLPSRPRYLAIAPISHVTGTKIQPSLMRGGTVHLLKSFDPEQICATVERERINTTLLVPTMIYGLLDHPSLERADMSSLELLLYGASPMSPTRLVEGLERIGPVFAQLYGQTECYPISILSRADHDLARPERFASCGFPVASCDVKLLDDAGNPVAQGEAGEICVRSPYVMDEYFRRPEQTAETLHGGWLHTGDVARADEEGCLFIVDRKKDMIVSGGFNIYPREVEDALSTHPAVAAAAVIGVPDPKWGEAVMALIVRRPGADVSAETLMDTVKRLKGGTHTPKRVAFVESLPLTGVGKVDKKALRSAYWADQERMVG